MIPELLRMARNMEGLRQAFRELWEKGRSRFRGEPEELPDIPPPPEGTREVLFICTGNYYRSRFAEAIFNHNAIEAELPWRAFSRGVAVHLAPSDLSPHTREALEARGIDSRLTAPSRLRLEEEDLRRAARRIALKRTEHEAYIEKQFPEWRDRIEYWQIDDIDVASPDEALPLLEQAILRLLRELQREAN